MFLGLDKISDDLLVCLWREKNQDAFDLLQTRYNYFIFGIIKDILNKYDKFFDYADLYQESFMAFLRCIESYDEENGCFYFFVRRSIERALINYIKKNMRYMEIKSIDNMVYEDSRESYVDYIAEEKNDFCDSTLYEKLTNKLDDVNKLIVDYKIDGYTYNEIAKMLGLTRGSIYSRASKIKNILKDIIEKID